MDHILRFSNSLHIYTDGSKDPENNTAFAFHIPELNEEKSLKINPLSSVFTSELLAIKTALEWSIKNVHSNNNITIFSDSKSSLQAIQNYNPKNTSTLLQNIIEITTKFKNHITLVWIPSHVGILGNEKADKLAKQATLNSSIDINNKISYQETLPTIKNYINSKWQDSYNSNPASKHYRTIEPNVSRSLKFSHSDRIKETSITRLRLGKCYLPFYLHTIKKHPTGLCKTCK